MTVPPHLIANGLPGSPNDRRSPAGELNWVFTAITDAIAWASLPRELFRRLFRQVCACANAWVRSCYVDTPRRDARLLHLSCRGWPLRPAQPSAGELALQPSPLTSLVPSPLLQDMLLASLFRNFLLAQRILGRFNLHPTSAPPIPSTHNHPLWDSWDLAVETSIVQMNAATKAAHAAAAAAVTEAATASMGLGAGSKAAPSGGLSASAVAADVGNSTTCRGAAGAVAREPGAVGASTSADALKAGGAGSRAQPAAAVPSSGELMASAATMASPMAIIVPPSSFFAEQLLAFETWLTRGVDRESAPTEQLLVLLQVRVASRPSMDMAPALHRAAAPAPLRAARRVQTLSFSMPRVARSRLRRLRSHPPALRRCFSRPLIATRRSSSLRDSSQLARGRCGTCSMLVRTRLGPPAGRRVNRGPLKDHGARTGCARLCS